MGLLSSITSGLFGLAGSSYSAHLAYKNATKLMDKQYDQVMSAYKESPSAEVEGLQAAGLNPILAASDVSSNGGSFGSSGTSVPDMGASITNAASKAMDRKLANKTMEVQDAQIEDTNATAALKREQVLTEQAKQNQMQVDNALTEVNTQLASKNVSWYDKRQLTELQTMLENAKANSLSAAASQMSAQASLKNASTNAMAHDLAERQFGEQQRQFNTTSVQDKWLQEWSKKHPNVFGASQLMRQFNPMIDAGTSLLRTNAFTGDRHYTSDSITSGGRTITKSSSTRRPAKRR